VLLVVRFYLGTSAGRYAWDRMKLRLPIIGELVHKATLARFTRSFALASRSGVPIVQALAIVGNVVDNAFMEARITAMRSGIERGETILRTAVAAAIFNPLVLQMIAVGEETGEIDSMMEDVADLYEKEVALISFSRRALLRCRGLAPEIVRGHLFHRAEPGEVLAAAREVASDLVMPEKGMLSEDLRDRAREAGLKVATWVVDDPGELPSLARFELYGIGSNRPGVLLEALREGE